MMNLLRSDIYRACRLYRLRGVFWQYAVALTCVILLFVVLFWLVTSGIYADMLASMGQGRSAADVQVGVDFVTSSPSVFFGQTFASGATCALFSSFGMLQLVFYDLTDGYIRGLLASLRGRLTYFAEKALLAGVWSAGMLVVGMVVSTVSLYAFGIGFTAGDDPLRFALWAVETWLADWALTVIPLSVAVLSRIKPLSYLTALALGAGMVADLLRGLAFSSGGILRVLQPIAPWLIRAANWMPSTVLDELSAGAAVFERQIDGGIVALLPGGLATKFALVGIVWVAVGAAALCLAGRARDL